MIRRVFPFTAVMGQEAVKNALIWNLINPRIGGVLISGQKGTAKSTLVRGVEQIADKRIVELPLNITEDRLIGAIDFEQAIRYGRKTLDRGLLARADGAILYVDEINLLSDNIVKALLEAASDGFCRVEREGISEAYPSRFILVGSMNPEESGLRPQLLDRFGLYVDVTAETDPLVRCEIVRRRIAFEADPAGFLAAWQEEEEKLKDRICAAQQRLSRVTVSQSAMELAAQLARDAHCAGSRGELAIIETARAICAWSGASAVNREAITEAAKYALPHRMRDGVPEPQEPEQEEPEQPEDQEQNQQEDQEQSEEQTEEQTEQTPQQQETPASESPQPEEQPQPPEQPGESKTGEAEDKLDAPGEIFEVGKWLDTKSKLSVHRGSGRRSLVKTDTRQGRYVKSSMNRRGEVDLAFDATLRAAAPYQRIREKNGLALAIDDRDIRTKIREKRTGNFIVFAVDASGSMGVGKRMSAVKGAVLSLLTDAYQKRDKVALITFRKTGAELVLGMTRSVDLAAKRMETLATGGKTPLYAGLELAHSVISAAKRREKDLLPVLVLISDGRATLGRGGKPFDDAVAEARAIAADGIKSVVIDVEQDFIRLRMAEKLAKEMDAQVCHISDLKMGAILSAISLATSQK